MATQSLLTAEQFDKLPQEEGRRYELLDGELIELASATPEHNYVLGALSYSVKTWLRQTRWGVDLFDIEFAIGPTRRLHPDLAILQSAKWAQVDRRKIPVTVIPDIAVEIVSPSESARDLGRKVEAYLEAGVAEVWVIYPEDRRVSVETNQSARRLRSADLLDCALLPGWSISLRALFGEEHA